MSHAPFSRKRTTPVTMTQSVPKIAASSLQIARSDDAFEQDADRVADQIVASASGTPAWSFSTMNVGARLQRKCECSGSGECKECKCKECKDKKDLTLQRHADRTSPPTTVPPIVHDVLRSPGQPLDPDTRVFMEPRLGHDFSRVRIHADTKSGESARAVNALAYTVHHDIVFDSGQYAPRTVEGKKLLAHELTHVVQQATAPDGDLANLSFDRSECAEAEARRMASALTSSNSFDTDYRKSKAPLHAASLSLQRSFGQDRCSGAGATCASPGECAAPDHASTGEQRASTAWSLIVNIDLERSSWESALRNQEFGHTYVRFQEDNGREYTYGFYPASQLPNENRRTVPGCVHHPDRTHDKCIDDKVTYSLTQDQYNAGLQTAQRICAAGHAYGANYTCTTFADEVVSSAGQTLPSSRSEPTEVYSTRVPSIDNPNTLEENVQKERAKLPLGRGEYWNAPATPATRAQVMQLNVNDIVMWVQSQNHRMAFLTLNALNMQEMLDTLSQVSGRIDLKTSLIDFLPVAQGVNKARLTAALRAVQLRTSFIGPLSPEQINGIINVDPALPDDQRKIITAYLGGAGR